MGLVQIEIEKKGRKRKIWTSRAYAERHYGLAPLPARASKSAASLAGGVDDHPTAPTAVKPEKTGAAKGTRNRKGVEE